MLSRLNIVALAAALTIIACDSGPTEPPTPVASVEITDLPSEATLMMGATVQLDAVAKDAEGSTLERRITWESSDPGIATVSSLGVVTSVSSGVVLITAEAGGETGYAALAVRIAVPVPAAGAPAPLTTSLLDNTLSLIVSPGATAAASINAGRAFILTDDTRILVPTAFAIGPQSVTFAAPVTAEVAVDLPSIPVNKRAGLRLFRVSPEGDVEGIASSSVDLVRGVVVSPIAGAGTYVVIVPGDATQLVHAEGASRRVERGTAVPGIGVIARDALGRPVPGASIEFSVEGAGSIVGDTIALTDIDGRADLPGEWIAGPDKGDYVLRARLLGAPLSVQFTADAFAPAVAVRIETAPTAGLSGVNIAGAMPVEIIDADGDRTEDDLTVSLALIGGSGTLVGAPQQLAVFGGAIFQGLRIDGPGTYRIVASSPGLAPDTTGEITITQQVAWLTMLTQPAGAQSGLPFTTQPVLEFRDHAGLRVIGGSAAITASAHGTGTLFGTRTVHAVDGVATFTDLAVEGVGTLQINFVTDGPVNVLSNELVVAPAPPGVRLLIGASPVVDMDPGQSFGVSLVADLSNRGGADVAALDVTLTWDPARFEYVTRSVGPWRDSSMTEAQIIVDESQVAAGTIRFTGTASTATIATFMLGQAILRTLETATTVESLVTATVHSAANAAAAPVSVSVLPMTVTVRAP